MRTLMEDCYDWEGNHDGEHALCFKLVYPVIYIMPDGSEITVADRTDWTAIKSWYEANPDSKERPVLKYPVDVTLSDGTIMTINDADQMHTLVKDCYDWGGHHYGDHDGDGD